MGESEIRLENDPIRRRELSQTYNSYGLGKTHLAIAISKELLRSI
ncbi:hypothetical protein [Thermoflavimicrobium dichotomicum]|nr:hypothetical protein [Thermoflavimicrobium dichotomicum]